MREKIYLVLENCEVIAFNSKDVYVEFDTLGVGIFKGVKDIRIVNVLIHIKKDAKAKVLPFEEQDWQERLKTPDITHIEFDGERYAIWEYKGEYNNEWQKMTETDDEYVIHISKKNK